MTLAIISDILSAVIVLVASKELSKASTISPTYIAPIVSVLCVVGVFAARQEILDVPLVILLGFFSYKLRGAGFPTLPLIIGFILGSSVFNGQCFNFLEAADVIIKVVHTGC